MARLIRIRILIFFFLFLFLTNQLAFSEPPTSTIKSKEKEIKQLELDLFEIQREINSLNEFKISLENHLEVINANIAINYLKLDEVKVKLQRRRDVLKRRVKDIYVNGAIPFLEVILKSRDFADFLSRITFLAQILKQDLRLLSEIKKETRSIKRLKNQLVEERKKQAYIYREYQVKVNLLKQRENEKQRLLALANDELRRLIWEEGEKSRERWLLAARNSYSPDALIKMVQVRVFPYNDLFITSERMPRSYRGTSSFLYGISSWYGPGFHGRRTSSGEIFNQNDMTCAHKTLPLGTFLAITYRDKRIVVKVNDRGPFIPGRVFDLSKAAAYTLGFTGLAYVKAEIIEPE